VLLVGGPRSHRASRRQHCPQSVSGPRVLIQPNFRRGARMANQRQLDPALSDRLGTQFP
jgi:hypothetical protein